MPKVFRALLLVCVGCTFLIMAGAFFYQKQVSTAVNIVKSDVGQDIVNSQLLQAERRIEILRRLGFGDLQIFYAGLQGTAKECYFNSHYPIYIDGVQVGYINNCPKLKTITNFLFGSIFFRASAIIILALFIASFTVPLYRYKKSIQKFILEAQKKEYAYFDDIDHQDSVVSEIHSVLKRMYLSKSKIDQLEYENKKSQALNAQAKQVAHDIRSPLSALNMISQVLTSLPEDHRSVLKGATQRINDIANELLTKSNSQNEFVESPHSEKVNLTEPVADIIKDIVLEKRAQYQNKPNIKIESDVQADAQLVICPISSSDLKRIVSNLVNNSIEALNDEQGTVKIGVRSYESKIQLTIIDDGIGIPQQVISKVGQEGFSFGKSCKESGSGLGLFHAKRVVEQGGGIFALKSQEGLGTMVTMTIPVSR